MAETSLFDSRKFQLQEYNRKFYTDLNDMRIEFGLPPKKYHLDLLEDEVFTRTIFIKIHNGIYAISGKELNQVFSTFGTLDTVEVFRHGHGFHSKICFNSKESTMRAFEFLNGRNIYDDCCTLELFVVQENFDAQMKAESGVDVFGSCADESNQESMVGSLTSRIDFRGDNSHDTRLKITKSSLVEKETSLAISGQMARNRPSVPSTHEVGSTLGANSEVAPEEASTWGSRKRSFADGFQEVEASAKQLLQTFQQIRADFQEWREEVEASTQEIVPSKVAQVSVGSFLDAHNLLEEMPMEDGSSKLQEMDDFEPLKVISIPLLAVSDIEFENKNEWVADSVEPIGLSWGDVLITSTKALDILSAHKLFDELPKRKTEVNSMSLSSTVVYLGIKIMVDDSFLIVVDNMGLVFDPGGVVDHGRYHFDSSYAAGLVHIWSELVWVFDPGGSLTSINSCSEFC